MTGKGAVVTDPHFLLFFNTANLYNAPVVVIFNCQTHNEQSLDTNELKNYSVLFRSLYLRPYFIDLSISLWRF